MPPGRTASCLIGGNTITKDFIIAHRILPLTAAITGISLDGIDNAVFAFFHDTHMVGLSVLGTGRTIRGIPIKEDNHTRCRFYAVVSPLSPILEPLDAVHAACEFGNNAVLDIAALVGAPANKAGAPLHAGGKAVPAPIGLAAHVAFCHDFSPKPSMAMISSR